MFSTSLKRIVLLGVDCVLNAVSQEISTFSLLFSSVQCSHFQLSMLTLVSFEFELTNFIFQHYFPILGYFQLLQLGASVILVIFLGRSRKFGVLVTYLNTVVLEKNLIKRTYLPFHFQYGGFLCLIPCCHLRHRLTLKRDFKFRVYSNTKQLD